MSVYLVTYDLRADKGSHDYQPVWNFFDLRIAHKVLESVYLIEYAGTAFELEAELKKLIHRFDRLFITKLKPNEGLYENYSTEFPMTGTYEWLTAHEPK